MGLEYKKISVITEKGKKFSISELFSEIQYIKLETNNQNSIAIIDKMLIHNNRIFIFDSQTMKISIFSRNGSFINQNNNIGRGPGEFQYISDFLVDPISNSIELLDNGNRKIIKLDQNGKFIKERPFTFYAQNFCKIGVNEYAFLIDNYPNPTLYTDQSYNLMILDSVNHLINSFLPINELIYLTGLSENRFVQDLNGVNFAFSYSNNIYRYSKDSCKLTYNLDFGKNNLDDNLLLEYNKIDKSDLFKRSKGFTEIIKAANENSYVTSVKNIFENERILTFQYGVFIPGEKDGTYTVIYDKRSKKIYSGKPDNDIDLGLFGAPLALIGDTLFTYVYPDKLLSKVKDIQTIEKSNHSNPKFIQLIDFVSSVNDFDNPIITKFIIKK